MKTSKKKALACCFSTLIIVCALALSGCGSREATVDASLAATDTTAVQSTMSVDNSENALAEMSGADEEVPYCWMAGWCRGGETCCSGNAVWDWGCARWFDDAGRCCRGGGSTCGDHYDCC